MISKIRFGKSFIALLLSVCMVFAMAVPAFAMETEDELNISFFSNGIDPDDVEEPIKAVQHALQRFVNKYDEDQERARLEANSWTALANSFFGGIVSNIGSVLTVVNGSITLLKTLGVLESETDKMDNILEGINSIKATVNEIDRNVDKIQETLISEFSELDMKFQEQEYNHYKNEVWAQFYSQAVVPMNALQNEYNDDVRWLLVNYIEQWQGADRCPMDLRALYGADGKGGYTQLYSGKNLGDIGEALPREPKTSVDSVPVEYSVTIPSEYISANFDELSALTADNCTDKLIEALEKGVYEAAQDKKLSAYDGFDTEWSYLSEDEKHETAKQFAADLADSLAFACAYNAANERRFASNVKSAYDNFAKWVHGEESLTSPAFAQFKMLSLTHGFEGEIKDKAETVVAYLMLMDVNFATFTQTVISLSKAHGEDDSEDIQKQWTSSEISILSDYASFITGNPNYCYQLGKPIEYRNTSISSELSFIFGRWADHGDGNIYKYKEHYESTPWTLFESEEAYSSDKSAAQTQKNLSQNMLTEKTVSTKDVKLIYTMYQSSGFDGTFAEYLALNNVAIDSQAVAEKIITSFRTGSFDLNNGIEMKCYLPTEHPSENVTDGQTYVVSSGVPSALKKDFYHIHDQAAGSAFDSTNGTFNENAILAARAFYGERKSSNMDEMAIFSKTPIEYKWTSLSYDELTDMGVDPSMDENYNVVVDITADYGMLISAEPNTYTFPADTKEIPDNYFGKDILFNSIIFNGIPEKIESNAFLGIGTPAERCLLVTPADFEVGSLKNKWHGGWFGNTSITLHKNDGSNEIKTTAAVLGDSAENVVNPFNAPVGSVFRGWSTSADAFEPEFNLSVVPGMELYAVWEADHEHDFEITDAKAATCMESGASGEKVCKICGLKVPSEITAPCGHTCTFNKLTDGNYRIYCTDCGYVRVLYPENYGSFKVWSRDIPEGGIRYEETKYEGNKLVIDGSGVYVIECINTPAAQSISVNSGVATIGLAGVDIAPSANVSAVSAAADTTVRLTLLDGTENRIAGGWGTAAIDACGKLVIDGGGSLTATAVNDPAIIVPEAGAEFRSGCITAESEKSKGIGVRTGKEDNEVIIGTNACVCSNDGVGGVTVNDKNEKVYLAEIENKNNDEISVDGNILPFKSAPGKDSAYVYLTGKDHTIKVGEEEKELVFNGSGFSYINEYGPFSVKTSDTNAVKYENSVLRIIDSVPVEISNIDSSVPTDSRIVVAGEINADVTLAGVNISTLRSENGGSPFEIEPGDGEVKVTLADGTANKLTAAIYKAALSKNGGSGTLTIDGNGSLEAEGGPYAAAIGSDFNNIVRSIRIDGGNIKATATYGGAGIGSGGSGTAALVTVETLPDGGTVAYSCSGITVNGGNITAESDYGAGIGCGNSSANSETVYAARDITVNGGTVIASSEYMAAGIGAGMNCAAKNVRINGGVVTASTKNEDCGGIGSCVSFSGLVIGPMASVKSTFDAEPVNAQGKSVYLNKIDVNGTSAVVIDGVQFPYTDHNGEKALYVYLPKAAQTETKPLVKIGECENGTVITSVSSASAGVRVTLDPVADEGYAFKKYISTPEVEITDNSFIMPEGGITVKAVFSRIGSITVKDCENCTVTPSKSLSVSGEKITLRIVPDEGMEIGKWVISPESVEITNNTFFMPQEDVTVSCICVPKTHTVTWNVDGTKEIKEIKYGEKIVQPDEPEKTGYNFEGWTPDVAEFMPDDDIEYVAVFSKNVYFADFTVNGKTVASVPYSLGDIIKEPDVPEKVGYSGEWEDYELKIGGITVNAKYVPEVYMAKFVADDKVIDELPYTVETDYIEEPSIPEKDGYTARWSGYTFHAGGITVNAVYTALTHEHTFDTEYSKNEYSHWYAPTCEHTELVKGMELHSFVKNEGVDGEITYTCSVCGYEKGEDETAKALAEAQSALVEANKALEDKSAALKTAEENLGKASDELKTAQDALKDKTAALKMAEDNLASANSNLEFAKAQVNTLTSVLDNANNELADAKAALNKANASLETAREEKAGLESQLEDKETELANLRKSADAKDEEIEALEKSISDLNAAVEIKNSEITAKAGEIASLENNISALENEVSKAKAEITEKNDRIKALSEQLEEANAEIEKLRNGEITSCPYCGKEKHENFFDKLICVFKRIGYFFKILFDFSMDKKN